MKLAALILLLASCANPRHIVVDCHDIVPLDPKYGPNVCDNSGADGGGR